LAASRARVFRVTLGPSLESSLEASADETARRTFMDGLEAGMRRRLKIDPAPIANIVAILSFAKV
jgi:hypothetical protein